MRACVCILKCRMGRSKQRNDCGCEVDSHKTKWAKHSRCRHEYKTPKCRVTYVYLLSTRISAKRGQPQTPAHKPHTYIGCTNDPIRRARQHNQREPGGARYTKRVGRAGTWAIRALIGGFCCRMTALKFERAWKDANKADYRKTAMEAAAGVDRIDAKLRIAQKLIDRSGCKSLHIKRTGQKRKRKRAPSNRHHKMTSEARDISPSGYDAGSDDGDDNKRTTARQQQAKKRRKCTPLEFKHVVDVPNLCLEYARLFAVEDSMDNGGSPE